MSDIPCPEKSFPVEIFELIIDQVAQNPSDPNTRVALRNCLPVSRAFYRQARTYVFVDVRIHDRHGIAATLDQISTLAAILMHEYRVWDVPRLISCVRSITLDLGTTDSYGCLTIAKSKDLIRILSELQSSSNRLRSLSLYAKDHDSRTGRLQWPLLYPEFIQAFHGLCMHPHLEHLSLSTISDFPARFLHGASIKHLVLDDVGIKDFSRDQLHAQGFGPHFGQTPMPPSLWSLNIRLRSVSEIHLLLLGSSTDESPYTLPFYQLRTLSLSIHDKTVDTDSGAIQEIFIQAPSLTTLDIQNFNNLAAPINITEYMYPCLNHLKLSLHPSTQFDAYELRLNNTWSTWMSADNFHIDTLKVSLPFSTRVHGRSLQANAFDSSDTTRYWKNLADDLSRLLSITISKVIFTIHLMDDPDSPELEDIEIAARRCLESAFHPLLQSRSGTFKCYVVCGAGDP